MIIKYSDESVLLTPVFILESKFGEHKAGLWIIYYVPGSGA